MKKCLAVLMFAIASVSVNAGKKDPNFLNAIWHGADAKIELHILDDDEMPVDEAKVRAYLGMNFRPKGKWVEGTTDTNGVFVIKGKTCGDEIEVFVTKDGYYDSHVVYRYAKMGAEHEVKGGKWQPYGAEEKVKLRKVRDPIPLVLFDERRFCHTKCVNMWLGYDLRERDFVAPHGKGRISDFDVYIEWDGKWLPDYRGMGVRIRFPDGFAGYSPIDVVAESEFLGPYSVSAAFVYRKEACFYERVLNDGKKEEEQFDRHKCWVVRTRCMVNDAGQLISANYAIIHDVELSCDLGGIAGFCVMGAYNPTPNDTNLEPKR